METQKYLFSTRVGTSLGATDAPSPTALVMKASGPDLGDGPVPKAPKVDADRFRRPSSPPTGLKPIADELRSVLSFGSPKCGGQHDQTRRNTGGVARSQVDPPHGGTGARAPRQGRWRDRSPLRLRGYMAGPASLATIPPLAALREARLNGFPGAPAAVRRHCIGGSRRRVSYTSPMGSLDAANVGKPAYPRYNRGAGEGRCPFDPQQTRAPVDCAGGGIAPVPPVTAQPDG